MHDLGRRSTIVRTQNSKRANRRNLKRVHSLYGYNCTLYERTFNKRRLLKSSAYRSKAHGKAKNDQSSNNEIKSI